eukprot:7917332-Prorocentrum_lima.AAC.1
MKWPPDVETHPSILVHTQWPVQRSAEFIDVNPTLERILQQCVDFDTYEQLWSPWKVRPGTL